MNRRLNLEDAQFDSIMKRDDDSIEGLTFAEIQAIVSMIIVAGSETTVSVLSGTKVLSSFI